MSYKLEFAPSRYCPVQFAINYLPFQQAIENNNVLFLLLLLTESAWEFGWGGTFVKL